MRELRSVLAALIAAWTICGCVPRPPAPTVTTPPASQGAYLCEQLNRVYGERAALGDAFRLVIGNDLDGAVEQARRIRSRLDDLVAGLPPPIMVAESRAALREAIQDLADLVSEAAAIIDRPGGADVDRELVLAEGESILWVIDEIFRPREANDPITVACPDLGLSVEPVSFPPPPTNADLGLPDTIGELTLEAHVGSVGSRLSGVLESVDVNPAAFRQITVHLSDLRGVFHLVEVVDGVPAQPATLADAVRVAIIPEAKAVAPETIAGFQVFAYHDLGDQISVHVAVRGDRVVILYDFADPLVREFVAAMP